MKARGNSLATPASRLIKACLVLALISAKSQSDCLALDYQYYRFWFEGQQRMQEPANQGYVGEQLLMQLRLSNLGQQSLWGIDLDQDLPQNTRLISAQPYEDLWLSADGDVFHPWPWQQDQEFKRVRSLRWQINDISPDQELLFELIFEVLP